MIIYNHNGEASDISNPVGMEKPPEGKKPYDIGNRAIAYIIDDEVVETSVANSEYLNILLDSFLVVDVTNEYPDVDSTDSYVLKFMINEEEKLTVGVLKRYGAIMLSNPKIVEIPIEFRAVEPGWKYIDNTFVLPENFNPYSDDIV